MSFNTRLLFDKWEFQFIQSMDFYLLIVLYRLLSDLPAPADFRAEKLRVTPHEFEKDDDSNGHIDYIVGQ